MIYGTVPSYGDWSLAVITRLYSDPGLLLFRPKTGRDWLAFRASSLFSSLHRDVCVSADDLSVSRWPGTDLYTSNSRQIWSGA